MTEDSSTSRDIQLNLSLSADYVRVIRSLLRWSAYFLLIGLLMGLVMRETKRMSSGHIEFSLTGSLVHGHVFVVGCILPVVMISMMIFGRLIGAPEMKYSTLKWVLRLFYFGSALSLLLLFYKGVLLEVEAKSLLRSGTSLEALEAEYYQAEARLFSSRALRAALYAIAHIAMTKGLAVFAVAYLRTLNRIKNA